MKEYWKQRYIEKRTGWDLEEISLPLKTYFGQLKNKGIKILIPGAGNSHEAKYLFKNGFYNVDVLDITDEPLTMFSKMNPDFPKNRLIQNDFFNFEGQYDLIIEQTFFCSFPPKPSTRHLYAKKMFNLLKPNGKLVGLWFDIPLNEDMEKRPFGGNKKEYLEYFFPLFKVHSFDKCYNSVKSRANNELFGIFQKTEILKQQSETNQLYIPKK